MKEPVKNAVAQAVGKAMPPSPDVNVALLQAQAEVKALRYTAQEITAQRDTAANQSAEFAARLRIASEENAALHKALQAADAALEAQRAEILELRADLDAPIPPRIAADSIEMPGARQEQSNVALAN